jgi:hypothetical protein
MEMICRLSVSARTGQKNILSMKLEFQLIHGSVWRSIEFRGFDLHSILFLREQIMSRASNQSQKRTSIDTL